MFPVLWMYAPCLQKINNINKHQEIPGKLPGFFMPVKALFQAYSDHIPIFLKGSPDFF